MNGLLLLITNPTKLKLVKRFHNFDDFNSDTSMVTKWQPTKELLQFSNSSNRRRYPIKTKILFYKTTRT